MILKEKFIKEGKEYNRMIEATDWRYSATIVGMIRFFESMNINYYTEGRYLYYNYESIYSENLETDLEKDKKYLLFAEKRFSDRMYHRNLVISLQKTEFSPKEIKDINKIMASNTVMKKIFKNIKFDGENIKEIERLIDDNRLELIKETFKYSKDGYRKYINESKFRSGDGEICRLLGFYVDTGRKTKSLGFCFDKEARISNDHFEFDFLPFGFSRGTTSIFINNNTSIERLMKSNNDIDHFLREKMEKGNHWNTCFYSYSEGGQFINYDVEVIEKNNDIEFYKTLFIRRAAIDIFDQIVKSWKQGARLEPVLKRFIKISDDYYIDIMKEVTENILNGNLLDDLIESLIKWEYSKKATKIDSFLIGNLIRINEIIYNGHGKKEENMKVKTNLKGSTAAAFQVVKYFKDNKQEKKIKTYRQRLANTLVAKDYDRFIEIVLQISSYTEIAFPFMHVLIGDFEGNKNLAYDFVNSLIDLSEQKKNEDSQNGGNEE